MAFLRSSSLSEEAIKSGGQEVLSAVLPLLKFLTLSIFGLVLSHPKIDLVPKATLKTLSKLVFALFLPCLIFTNLGPTINLANLIQWWFIPVNVLLSTALGCGLGLAVALACRPPPEFFRFTVITTGFGNTGNLALAVVDSACRTRAGTPFGPGCRASGVAYVAFSQWAAAVLVYTLVYHMMEPPFEYYELVEEAEDESSSSSAADQIGPAAIEASNTDNSTVVNFSASSLLVEAEWPGIEAKETQHCKTPLIARVFSNNDFTAVHSEAEAKAKAKAAPESPKSIHCLAEPGIVRRIRIVAERTPIRHILSPPTIASLLAITIGMFPGFKAFVFDEDSPASVLTDSLRILAEAMVPSAMLVLGGMLAEGPKSRSSLGLRTTIGIVVARLLVLPLVGIGVVGLADRLGLLVDGDRLFRFVLLLQYTTPSAILLGAIASLRGYAVKEASAVLFWQHVIAVLTFSFYVIVYFNLLLSSPYA